MSKKGRESVKSNQAKRNTSKQKTKESTESVRTMANYFTSLMQEGVHSVAITSHTIHQGKTEQIIELAIEMAMRGKNVLLIDANYFAPEISKRFNIEDREGLINLCEKMSMTNNGKEQLPMGELKYITKNVINHLSIMPLGVHKKTQEEIFYLSEDVKQIIESYKSIYDLVLVETPSFEHLSFVQSLCSALDGVVLVLKSGLLKVTDAEVVKEQISSLDCKQLGCFIVTNLKHKSRRKHNVAGQQESRRPVMKTIEEYC